MWTYAPVEQTATQHRTHLKASHPYEVLSDDAGNHILHFLFEDLPPYATKIVTITVDLLLSETPLSTPNPSQDGNSYLRAEQYCESDDPDIAQLAQQLHTSTPAATVKNIIDWVASHVNYIGYLKNPRGARYALKYKQGDCTEFMYLFMALCRAAGIPARGVGGYVTSKSTILKPAEYHNWAEFYDDGIWKIADPHKECVQAEPIGLSDHADHW